MKWGGWGAVTYNRMRAEERKRRWEEMTALANQNKVGEYFRKYAEYLEWDNLLSDGRKELHKMALAAAERLSEK